MSDNFLIEQLFYNDTVKLIYDDSLHAYYVEENGERYLVPSATGVCSMIDKSGPLMPWAAKMVVEYIGARAMFAGCIDEAYPNNACLQFPDVNTKEDWEQFLLDAKKNFRTISETALDVGSLAHDWLEAYTQAMIDGVEYNAPLPANDAACKAITAALDWHRAHNFRPIAAEQKVYSKSLNCAGTFDWTAIIDSCDDPKCCKFKFHDCYALGDYKSSKAIYDEYKIQTAFYKHALDEISAFNFEHSLNTKPKIELRVVLRLGKNDGDFESLILGNVTEYEQDLAAFEGALAIYSWKEQMRLDSKAEKQKLKLLKPKKTTRKIKIPKAEGIPVVDS